MGGKKSQLLVVDDDATIRRLLTYLGEQVGFEVSSASGGAEALEMISDRTEVLVLDLKMPEVDGFACLEHLAEKWPKVPTIVLSALDDPSDVVRAMKLGAVDYITKPFDPDEFKVVLLNARRLSRAERENEELREAIGGGGAKVEMVAASSQMKQISEQAKKVSNIDSTVLITGESGVGKGVLARTIHSDGERSEKPFVTVSCPAVPRELLESELFGHEKGAFTGATKRRIGKIEAAQGGTLFLDEIGDLPLDLQPKLLSVLQDREFQRVGGEATISVDVRVIAATNINFEEQIKEGSFREDLFYRLSVIPFELPPLRERNEEVEPLCESLLIKIGRRQKKKVVLSKEALCLLQRYDWPGNIRQLENVLERASAFCSEGMILEEDLPKEIIGCEEEGEISLKGVGGVSLARLEKEALIQTLELCGGNKAEASRRLGITEKSVYNKLKRHNL